MDKEVLNIKLDGDEEEVFTSWFNEGEKKEDVEGDGELVDGKIVSIDNESVMVDVGMKCEGRLGLDEITDTDGKLLFKKGDTISVLITGTTTEKPKISYKKAIKRTKTKQFIEENKDTLKDRVVRGVVTKKNNGGFMVDVDGIDMFLPSSLAGFKPKTNYINKTIEAKVFKVEEDKGSIVLSRKSYLNENRKKKKEAVSKLLDEENKDKVYETEIKSVKSYGVFVEIEGVEGLVHYTEISYKGPVNPVSVFQVGQKIEVKILKYDAEKKRLSLSMKAVNPNPWDTIADELEVGDTVKVYVTNMEKYGAFVDLGNEIEGFLHISEISWDKDIAHPSDLLKLDQEIDVEVIELDPKSQRLRVSLKKLQPKPFDEFAKTHKVGDLLKGKIISIKDFGCFVRVGNIDGLIKNEEISWDKAKNAKNTYNIGDEVELVLASIERDKERVSFSVKRLEKSPMEIYVSSRGIGDVVVGEIVDIKDFGVFVRLDESVDGLIRAEDLGNKKLEELTLGEKIESVILSVDKEKNRMRLSIRKLARKQEREILDKINHEEKGNDAFKDAFNALKNKR
ncbi:MAG: S1 RNA-binding domain-containing protein [Helicobacteraceae bacterium]